MSDGVGSAARSAQAFAARFPRTSAVVTQGIERGLHTGCQIYVSLDGSIAADVGLGESEPGVPQTPETLNLWLSSGKPLTAVAIVQAWEQGGLRLDDPVMRYLPEFAAAGKTRVTIRHLLTHTAGIRHVETGWPEIPWDETLARICAAPLEPDWILGRTAGYHTASSWFVLGEILQRLDGQPFPEVMRARILDPLGLSETWAALPVSEYSACQSRLGAIFSREQGELVRLDWDSPQRVASPSPGGNFRGPMRDLGRFYEMLLNEGMGPGGAILSPQSVDTLTARHRVGEYDLTLGHVVDFGLGVILDSNRYGAATVPYGYGAGCSPRAFGHGGAQSSQGWCDPESRLVVAYYFNGRAGEGQHNRRCRQFNEAVAYDLGLDAD